MEIYTIVTEFYERARNKPSWMRRRPLQLISTSMRSEYVAIDILGSVLKMINGKLFLLFEKSHYTK